MYDSNLERLIEAALADGVLTEKEKNVICKKAESLGIDRDEIMVYVEGLLDEQKERKKSSKEGNLHLCPNCGANIPSFVANCPECGYEIRGNKAGDTMEKFCKEYMETTDYKDRVDLVDSFPIPNNKEDLLEFMAMTTPLAMQTKRTPILIIMEAIICGALFLALLFPICGGDPGIGLGISIFLAVLAIIGTAIATSDKKSIWKNWEAKFKNAYLKAQILESNDPMFVKKMNIVSSAYKRYKRSKLITEVVLAAVIVALIITFSIMSNRTTEDKKSLEYQITTLIEEGKFDEANECQISMLPSGSRIENEKIYFNFLTRCVTKMCQEGNFDEATAFINAKSLYFAHERDWMNQKAVYTRWEAEEALSKIVESYKDTDKDK